MNKNILKKSEFESLQTFSKLIVEYSLDVKKGQRIAISGTLSTAIITKAISYAVIERGGLPYFLHQPTRYLGNKRGEQQKMTTMRLENDIVDFFDASVYIMGPDNFFINNLSESKNLYEEYKYLSRQGALWGVKGCVTVNYLRNLEQPDFINQNFLNACFLDEFDAIEAWRAHKEWQRTIISWLVGARNVNIHSSNTNLTFSVEGCRFARSYGIRCMPDGEIYTSPDPSTVNGYVSIKETFFLWGVRFSGIQFSFKDGKMVSMSAKENEVLLKKIISVDTGASRLGEFGIGTNPKITNLTGYPFFDEKILGTFHIALGQSYSLGRSRNDSVIHIDFVSDLRRGGEITVDGKVLIKNGIIQV
jgi:aminopeptidase